MRLLLLGLAVALASCDLYFPDHRIDVGGIVRDSTGAAVSEARITLRRSRFLYDTPLATAETDASGAYRLTHRLEGCAGSFDAFRVVAERVVRADTARADEGVACADGSQTIDLVLSR